jgi:hypothetical protein
VGESSWLFPALPVRVVFSRKQLSDVGIKKYTCRMQFARTKQQFIIANHTNFSTVHQAIYSTIWQLLIHRCAQNIGETMLLNRV